MLKKLGAQIKKRRKKVIKKSLQRTVDSCEISNKKTLMKLEAGENVTTETLAKVVKDLGGVSINIKWGEIKKKKP